MYTSSQLQQEIDRYIAGLKIDRNPENLYHPIDYILSLGGKRIRPVLMLMAYNLYQDTVAEILSPAAGIEIFHNYTLLHDDLMDNADMRRGNKTVHILWDDNTAILSGDAMFVLAYKCMAESPGYLKEIWDIFNETALEICEGQQYDINFEKRDNVTEVEYLEMIRLKTAVLLAASLKIGAILGGASEKDSNLLYDFGINVGLAFQLKDDYLDIYGNPAVFGKKNGGDILSDKKTYLLIKAFELAGNAEKNVLDKWINQSCVNSEEKIAAITDIYNQLNVRTICENKIQELYHAAMDILAQVNVDKKRKEELEHTIYNLMYREK